MTTQVSVEIDADNIIVVDVEVNDTILSFKKKINQCFASAAASSFRDLIDDTTSTQMKDQIVIHNNKVLADDKTFQDYNMIRYLTTNSIVRMREAIIYMQNNIPIDDDDDCNHDYENDIDCAYAMQNAINSFLQVTNETMNEIILDVKNIVNKHERAILNEILSSFYHPILRSLEKAHNKLLQDYGAEMNIKRTKINDKYVYLETDVMNALHKVKHNINCDDDLNKIRDYNEKLTHFRRCILEWREFQWDWKLENKYMKKTVIDDYHACIIEYYENITIIIECIDDIQKINKILTSELPDIIFNASRLEYPCKYLISKCIESQKCMEKFSTKNLTNLYAESIVRSLIKKAYAQCGGMSYAIGHDHNHWWREDLNTKNIILETLKLQPDIDFYTKNMNQIKILHQHTAALSDKLKVVNNILDESLFD